MLSQKDSIALEYIIEQNTKLNEKFNTIQIEMIELQHCNSELEEDNDRHSKTKSLLQGFLKNVNEINKKEVDIKDSYKILYITSDIHIKVSIIFMMFVLLCNTIFVQQDIFIISNTSFFVIYSTILGNHLKNAYNKQTYIKDLQRDLNNLKKATDLVTDLIDNV